MVEDEDKGNSGVGKDGPDWLFKFVVRNGVGDGSSSLARQAVCCQTAAKSAVQAIERNAADVEWQE